MRSTPLPKELKNVMFDSGLAVTLGEQSYHGKKTDVQFDLATLRYHAAFMGMSGMGKSTAMYNLVEDLVNLEGAGQLLGEPLLIHMVTYVRILQQEFHLRSNILFDILSFQKVKFLLMCMMLILCLQKIRLLKPLPMY